MVVAVDEIPLWEGSGTLFQADPMLSSSEGSSFTGNEWTCELETFEEKTCRPNPINREDVLTVLLKD